MSQIMTNRIQKFSGNGTFITEWGTEGEGTGQFNNPAGVAVDSEDNVYVTDVNNNRIQKFSSDGAFVTSWGSEGEGEGLYVADTGNFRIQVFSTE